MKRIKAGEADIPALGLGTYRLDDAGAERMVAAALDAGIRHIDTARMYDNEIGVGRGLRAAATGREDVFLTTKIWPDDFAGPNFRRAADAALRDLATDYVDLLLLHWPSPSVPLEETLGELGRLVEEGKVRHAGVSNFTIDLVARARAACPVPLAVDQVEHHPYLDQRALNRFLRSQGMALTAYCPLAQGRIADDPTLQRIAAAHGATPAQVTLAWLLGQDVIVIPKTGNPDRLSENLRALELDLTTEEMAEISALARPNGRLISPAGLAPDWD